MILTLGTTPAVQQSMTFDRVVVDGVNRATTTRRYASGKAVNAARVLHTLGHPVTATGFAGGEGGTVLINDLTAAGIAHDFVTVETPTRTCVTVIDRSTGQATELVEESAAVPMESYDRLISIFKSQMPNATGVVLAGSLPPGAPVDFYSRCLSVTGDVKTVLDAAGPPLAAVLAAGPFVVKPNRSELAATVDQPTGSDQQLKTAIKRLIDRGPRWVVVTDGPNPTTVSDGPTFWRLSSPAVAVVSPIGSGDSFAAGLMAGIVRGDDVPTACRLAVACGAANAMTADAGHLRMSDVEAISPVVRVERF